jgi:hypothetical protein
LLGRAGRRHGSKNTHGGIPRCVLRSRSATHGNQSCPGNRRPRRTGLRADGLDAWFENLRYWSQGSAAVSTQRSESGPPGRCARSYCDRWLNCHRIPQSRLAPSSPHASAWEQSPDAEASGMSHEQGSRCPITKLISSQCAHCRSRPPTHTERHHTPSTTAHTCLECFRTLGSWQTSTTSIAAKAMAARRTHSEQVHHMSRPFAAGRLTVTCDACGREVAALDVNTSSLAGQLMDLCTDHDQHWHSAHTGKTGAGEKQFDLATRPSARRT